MAGVGPSGPLKSGEYDVFLSFRGSDTRKNFTSCLYHGLVGAGIRVFRDDDELSKGKEIGNELMRAISSSRICMPILSPNFATSAWCLREVAHMVECKQNSGGRLEILPIFYNVDLADVKLRTGSIYEIHISEHRDRFEEDVLLKWKDALKKVGKVKGWSVNDDTDLGELIKVVVREIMDKLKTKYRNVPTHLIEVPDEVAKLMKLINVDSEGVRFIVIHGMGGIGKTTLANVVYNKLYSNYEGHSFLENVRERTKQHGLLALQKNLLRDILNYGFAMDVKDNNDGINMIRGRCCYKKALIVIDDVDEDRQLKNLAGGSDWFGSGSRIIITTRDLGVLTIEGEVHKYFYHEVKQLIFDDALCLFSRHAFGQDCPPHDYDHISKNIVSATTSLPLALEVVGSLLSCKCRESCVCMEIWKNALNELRRVPFKKVKETLMISIKKLDGMEKKVFLDIACFLVNEDKANAFYMWGACEISPHLVVNSLIKKSLIKIGDDNRFWMHDRLRDLGREIVHPENNLGRSSRVWIDQDAEEIINNDQGTEQVEVLCLYSGNFTLTYGALAKYRNLRFLKLQGGQFKKDLKGLVNWCSENLLPNLRWLHWHCLPSNFKMKNFCPSNLVVLELCNSSITEHWKGWRRLKTARKLKVLDLTGCEQLRRTPDFSSFLLLERLVLQGCHNLVEIDSSIGKLEKLTYLNMEGCSIWKLPEEIGVLTSLTTVIMKGRLQEFQLPDSMGNLTNLTSLEIRDVRITELPESIGELKNLKKLSLKNCKSLKKLPDSIGNLKSLVELDISRLSDIIELPDSIKNLKSVKVINMSRSGIRRLPATIGLLKSLEEIRAFGCLEMKGEIPLDIGGLSLLKILDLHESNLCGIPKGISKLSYLRELHLTLFKEYKNIDLRWICELSMLEVFTFNSSYVNTLKLPSALETLWMDDLTFMSGIPLNDVQSLAASIPCLEELQKLRNLWINSCNFYDLDGLHHLMNLRTLFISTYHKRFPDLSNLRNLILLSLNECHGLVKIQGLGKLQLLQTLLIQNCNSLGSLDGLSNLANLKWLKILRCEKLRGVEGLDKLTSLVVLMIEGCRSLNMLPDISLFGSQLVRLSIKCPMLPQWERGADSPIADELFKNTLETYFSWIFMWYNEK